MGDLEAKALERKKRTEAAKKENEVIAFFTQEHGVGAKDRPFSGRINGDVFDNFKKICKRKGITANSCINVLISEYVHENKSWLD